jgi:branched-subunit amino acid transport protein
MNIYIYIITMALVTYLIRAVPFVLFREKIENKFVNSFLYYVPYACLTALTLPAIFYSTDSVISAVAGLIVAIVLGIREKSLVVVAAAACVTVFVVERLLAVI